MSLDPDATAMSITLVWDKERVFENLTNEAFDYLLQHGYLIECDMKNPKTVYDIETSLRVAASNSCYQDPKTVFSVTQIVSGREYTYYAYHYPATNMALDNTGSLDKTLFMCAESLTDPKKVGMNMKGSMLLV